MRLSVRFPYALVAGHSSVARFRLTNGGVDAFSGSEISVEARNLAGLTTQRLRRIGPGQTHEFDVEIDPDRAGHSLLQVGLLVDDASGRRAFRGTHPLRVLKEPDGRINISIGDIQSNTGGGANAGLGADYGNVEISNLLGNHRPETLNDLLTTELANDFEPVALELDYGLSARAVDHAALQRHRSLALPRDYLGHVQPARRCLLQPVADGSPGPVALIVGDEFSLGRSRTDADLAAWWWPRSADFDDRTRRLSKIHARLAVEGEGFVAWDAGSSNGTSCDGQLLPPGDRAGGARFARRATLALAHQYLLDVHHLEATYPEGPNVRGAEPWPPAAAGRLRGCVAFRPTACEPTPFSSIWLFSEAAFGASAANAWVLAQPGVAEVQGRFHWYRQCFWVEGVASNRAVTIGGRVLQAGEIVPLTTGQRLQIGDVIWRVELSA